MKASLIGTLVIACVVSVGLLAGQEKPAPAAKKEHTMTGCLQKGAAADTFVVTNTAEKGPKTISIIESKEPLPRTSVTRSTSRGRMCRTPRLKP